VADKSPLKLDETTMERTLMEALSSKEAFLRTLWNLGRERVAQESGKIVAPVVTRAVGYFAPAHADNAESIGRLAGKVTHVGVAVGDNTKQFFQVGRDTVSNLRELRKQVAPYLSKGAGRFGVAPLQRSDNEVIQNARKRVLGRGKYDFYGATVGLAVLIPDLLTIAEKERGRNVGGTDEAALPVPDASTSASMLDRAEQHFDRVEGAARKQLGKVGDNPLLTPENKAKAGLVVKLGTPRLQQLVDNERDEQFGKSSAFDLIVDLSRQVEKSRGPVHKVMHKDKKKQMPLKEYVLEVFKQHQVDCEGVEINERRSGPDLDEACKQIADAIDHCQIDPMALIALVGERSIIDADLIVTPKEDVAHVLREVQRRAERVEEVDVEAYIADTAYTTSQEFKDVLDSMAEEEKPFFVSMFPDAVLRDAGGMAQTEIDTLKDQAFPDFNEKMTQAIQALSEMSQDDLKRSGLTEKESALVKKWAKSLDLDNPEAFAALDGDMMESLSDAVRNSKGYWQDRVRGSGAAGRVVGKEVTRSDAPAKDQESAGSFASRVRSGASETEQRVR
jgi:hypothetical protein